MNNNFIYLVVLASLLLACLEGLSRNPNGIRRVNALFVEDAPIIDGVMDDRIWQQVDPGSGLVQFQPNVGPPMTEKTEFKILYTKSALYLGIYCFDGNPSGVISRRTGRDRPYRFDDYIYFIVDTFLDRRNAYAFAINPLGAQWDALISQNSNVDENWNGVWQAKCKVNELGWFAEIEIPLSTIDFDPSAFSWGFNLERGIRRKSEIGRWSRPDPDLNTSAPSEGGEIRGFEKLKQELKFEFRPYTVAKYTRQNGEDDVDWEGGADLRYRWTPSLSATLSLNTDFAETEIDAPRVNFTRYPLFFDEKREFFLEDNAFYSFSQPWEDDRLLVPFHSRRIGLSKDRNVVPVLGALKVAGKSGPYQIGFTGVYVDEFETVDARELFATRITRNIGDESRVGMIATYGDPYSNGENLLSGFDYQYRTSGFLDDKNLEINLFGLTTHTNPVNDPSYSDEAFGFALDYSNEPLNFSFDMVEIGDDLDPALGFVKKTGIREYSGKVSYLYRPTEATFFRSLSFVSSHSIETDLSNNVLLKRYSIYPLNLVFLSDDFLSFGYNWYDDSFDFDWEIADGIPVYAGQYTNSDLSLSIGTSYSRPIAGGITFGYGEYYASDRLTITPYITFYPASFLELYFLYYNDHLKGDIQSLDTHIVRNSILFKFSPTLNWSNTFQWDNLSDFAGWNSRLDWEFRPGSHFYVVFLQNYLLSNHSIRVQESQVTTKCGLNIRF